MRIIVFVCIIFFVCFSSCGRQNHTRVAKSTSGLIVTGERGGDLKHQKCLLAGTATSNNDASDTYVYLLFVKYPIDLSKTVPPPSPGGGSTTDQDEGLIETRGDTSLGALLDRRFVLAKQTLVINGTTVDLTKGSIVMIELASDGKIKVTGQCSASAPFNDDPVKYASQLEPKCAALIRFMND